MPGKGGPTWSLHTERGYYTLLIKGPFRCKFPIDKWIYNFLKKSRKVNPQNGYLGRLENPKKGSFLVSVDCDGTASVQKDI